MARYTEEFLAALRHGYEHTDKPMRLLAREAGIGITTLQTLADKNGWTKRSQRTRGCPPATDLLAQAQALAANLPPRAGGRTDPGSSAGAVRKDAEETSAPTLSLARDERPTADALPSEAERDAAIGRLEALVLKEIAAEEAVRAELKVRPRARGETEKCARAISILTQTWQALQNMRAGVPLHTGPFDDDMPRDLDAFREELARRIDAFVAARPDEADAACADDADTGAAE